MTTQQPPQEPRSDGTAINWDNVAVETRMMIRLNERAQQALKESPGSTPGQGSSAT